MCYSSQNESPLLSPLPRLAAKPQSPVSPGVAEAPRVCVAAQNDEFPAVPEPADILLLHAESGERPAGHQPDDEAEH